MASLIYNHNVPAVSKEECHYKCDTIAGRYEIRTDEEIGEDRYKQRYETNRGSETVKERSGEAACETTSISVFYQRETALSQRTSRYEQSCW